MVNFNWKKRGKCDPIFMRLSLGTFTWKGWVWAVGLWCNKTKLWSPKDFTTPAKIQNPLMCDTIWDVSSLFFHLYFYLWLKLWLSMFPNSGLLFNLSLLTGRENKARACKENAIWMRMNVDLTLEHFREKFLEICFCTQPLCSFTSL